MGRADMTESRPPYDRDAAWDALASRTFDLLVIGAGATGTGVAVDAASRGLSVALVERDDVSSGTSSRSTKLIHGGVRYLEQAVKKFDRKQFALVRDALAERATLLRIAPHLARPLPLVTPLYQWIQVPYFMAGLKLYDGLAGSANLAPSRFVDAHEARQRFPMLKPEGLRGGVVYYDGQFDDARFAVALAATAVREGATLVTHASVTSLEHIEGRVAGATVRDEESGREATVRARAVVNATGPFADAVRRMDDPESSPMLTASSGIHVVLDARFSPPDTGLLIPETEDGRVLFLLPWLGHTLVGTTDAPAPIEAHPKATEEEVEYVLRHVRKYFDVPVDRSDVKATWSGLRPLVSDPNAADTARLSRDHVVNVSPSGLVTIAGGKWTTYRTMAVDTVDEAARVAGLEVRASATDRLPLVGAEAFRPTGAGEIQERFHLPADVASYLHRAYGDRAAAVAQIAVDLHGSRRLADGHPYLVAEIDYAVAHEFARTTTDVVARRTRLAFLDGTAARAAVDTVNARMQVLLGWTDEVARRDARAAHVYLEGT